MEDYIKYAVEYVDSSLIQHVPSDVCYYKELSKIAVNDSLSNIRHIKINQKEFDNPVTWIQSWNNLLAQSDDAINTLTSSSEELGFIRLEIIDPVMLILSNPANITTDLVNEITSLKEHLAQFGIESELLDSLYGNAMTVFHQQDEALMDQAIDALATSGVSEKDAQALISQKIKKRYCRSNVIGYSP